MHERAAAEIDSTEALLEESLNELDEALNEL